MLDWQVKWIDENWLKLLEKTTCGLPLVDNLRQQKLLTEDEIANLERMAIHDEHGNYKKVKEFYSLLKKRDAYHHLIQVLEQNFQTDAAQILKDGWDNEDGESRRKKRRLQNYISLPKELEEFLNRNKVNSGKICVISTLDCDVTCERIKDAGGIPVVKWEGTSFGFEMAMTENTTIAISHVHRVEQMVSHAISNGMQQSRRIIIVTEKTKADVLKEVQKSSFLTVAEDNLTFYDLSEPYKKDLLNRNVLIQGRLLPIKQWIHATGVSLNDNEVGGQLLIDLINDKTPVLLKSMLPKKLNYYVSRRLRSRTILNRDKIFQDRSKDVFVFTGLERYQLSTFVSEGHKELREREPHLDKIPPGTDTSKNQIKTHNLSVRFILLEHFFDFEDICEKTSEPVHWVRCEENEVYRLVKSRGRVKMIQGMVEEENKQTECSEEEFLDLISSEDFSKQHECISDSPGMGKSVLLVEVGRQSLKKNATTVGIFQELPEFIKSIKQKFPNKETRCADAIMQHLISSITTCDFSKSCLESGFNSQAVKINLFLDAYDEVDSKDVGVCKTILKLFKDCENIRVFITSRPHLLPELENIFEVLGWNILPFTEQDQYNYLLSCWKNRPEGQKYKKMEIDLPKLEKYTNQFVTALQNQWNDKDRTIAGIPLQCHLISVIYHVDILKSCSQGSSTNSSEVLPEIGSLTNLYTKMVEKKLDIFKEKYPTTSLDARKVNKWYAFQAFSDLFPDVDYEIVIDEDDDADPEEMIKIGIVERKGAEGKMEFIHRTFAEYFIAKALFQLLTNPQHTKFAQEFETTLVSFFKVLFTLGEYQYHNKEYFKSLPWLEILYHLNALLEDANTVCVIPLNFKFSEYYLKELTDSIVHEDLPNIFKLLQYWNCFTGIEDIIFNQKLIGTAVRNSSLKLIKMIIQCKTEKEMSEMVNDEEIGFIQLHYAVQRGDYNIFEFLLESYYEDKVKNCQDNTLSSLVYNCVHNSKYNRDVVITAKKEMIKRLLELNHRFLEFSLKCQTIFSLRIHLEIFAFFIERGFLIAKVFATDMYHGTTLLLYTCRSSEEFSYLVEILYKAGHLQELIRNCDFENFKRVFSKHTLSKDTYTIFKAVGLNLNTIGDKVLQHALSLENEKSLEYLKGLWDVCTEQKEDLSKFLKSSLQFAVKTLNLTMIALLIDTKGANVNCVRTSNGDTPLHTGSRIKCNPRSSALVTPEKVVKIIQLLLSKGGDPLFLNSHGESALHLAAENSCEEIVKLLVDTVQEINGKDCNGNTALLRAFRNTDSNSIINVLLKNGADPRILNSKGESVLHLAAEYSSEEIVKLFIDLVDYINGKDCNGNTALLRAVKNTDPISIINVLLKHGSDPKLSNNRGEIWLHVFSSNKIWVEQLFHKEGLSVDTTDKKGNTPLHFAALESDCLEVISKLVEKGGNINAVNEGGFTPFDVYLYQAKRHSLEVVKYFIARVPNKDQMTASLRTVIHCEFMMLLLECESMPPKINISLYVGNSMLPKDRITTAGIANQLISNGADVKGLISLILKGLENSYYATHYEFLTLLRDIEVCSLEIAYQGLVRMVKCTMISEDLKKLGKFFADHLDDINKTDSEGRTLLHLACIANNRDGVKFLVEIGAKVNELDRNGKTPLDLIHLKLLNLYKTSEPDRYSFWYLHLKEIAEFLKSHGAKDNISADERQAQNIAMKC